MAGAPHQRWPGRVTHRSIHRSENSKAGNHRASGKRWRRRPRHSGSPRISRLSGRNVRVQDQDERALPARHLRMGYYPERVPARSRTIRLGGLPQTDPLPERLGTDSRLRELSSRHPGRCLWTGLGHYFARLAARMCSRRKPRAARREDDCIPLLLQTSYTTWQPITSTAKHPYTGVPADSRTR